MDEAIIEEIVLRYRTLVPTSPHGDHLLFMRLVEAHSHHPMNLALMSLARGEDLIHDVEGIAQNFNSSTGEYDNLFWPRYAMQCGGQCCGTGS